MSKCWPERPSGSDGRTAVALVRLVLCGAPLGRRCRARVWIPERPGRRRTSTDAGKTPGRYGGFGPGLHLDGRLTIGAEQGLFLGETWRLHPDICAFTSELFHENRRTAIPGLERQAIRSAGRIQGSGLHFLPVVHQGNQNSSPEEAEAIGKLVAEILGSWTTWMDRKGVESAVTLEDILIIAPYNAQVFDLKGKIPGGRIGTVDKFQGQEAPIVFYSMTTSTHADAPWGMNFLYSLNRLNVATSRARGLSVLVCSPALFEPECKTPEQMKMANAFCRYLELAK
jgi:superfamily I DNA and/or RNA helicase